eukprot:CAMPEP_0181205446 /NCGR_PEP_ID=MMETSP1096-20121128/20479_1 /TAXON_ID=156174 ORGANISM="Chrysochromulina ericina, Strain CCMP281" /NCGR_SAMPLE_ID=MMETSP1096 /ASSEMBLY_ACC=CAM_ASM_000453 /LENGTH=150 /DNA_ID=CAMNT_0023296225 /DNA_START=841 /DNA_END=1289 /DNA_ORIENTATION=-
MRDLGAAARRPMRHRLSASPCHRPPPGCPSASAADHRIPPEPTEAAFPARRAAAEARGSPRSPPSCPRPNSGARRRPRTQAGAQSDFEAHRPGSPMTVSSTVERPLPPRRRLHSPDQMSFPRLTPSVCSSRGKIAAAGSVSQKTADESAP